MKAALVLGLVTILFAGCAGAQNGPVPSVASAQGRAHRESGSSGDLIYATTAKEVVVMSYPEGKIVGTIPWYYTFGDSICSDANGNVFVPEGSGTADSHVYEYAHGGTTPVATLSLPSGYAEPDGCALDPSTGNLAVNAERGPQNRGALLVYPDEQESPIVYGDKKIRFLGIRPTTVQVTSIALLGPKNIASASLNYQRASMTTDFLTLRAAIATLARCNGMERT